MNYVDRSGGYEEFDSEPDVLILAYKPFFFASYCLLKAREPVVIISLADGSLRVHLHSCQYMLQEDCSDNVVVVY